MAGNKKAILIGSGGHAKVLIETLRAIGIPVWGCTSLEAATYGSEVLGIVIKGSDDILDALDRQEFQLINAVGMVEPGPNARQAVFERLKSKGFHFGSVIHPSATVSSDVELGEGVQLMAGVIVQPACKIGDNVILNTRSSIDHDCSIGAGTHVAPGAVLSGNVKIGKGSFIGAGAVLIHDIQVGSGCLVAAGAVVVSTVADRRCVRGVPARVFQR